jgi:hypothetical protein
MRRFGVGYRCCQLWQVITTLRVMILGIRFLAAGWLSARWVRWAHPAVAQPAAILAGIGEQGSI